MARFPPIPPRHNLRNPLAVLRDSGEEEDVLVVALLHGLRAVHLLARVGIVPQIVHGRGKGHRRGREVLHLVRDQTMLLRELEQCRHLLDGAAWMRGDEVGNELLVLATLLVFTVELLQEDEELVEARLAHQPQHLGVSVLRSYFQSSGNVLVYNLMQVFTQPIL